MSSPPKTADELRALVDSHIPHLSPREQLRFWAIISDHEGNEVHRATLDIMSKLLDTQKNLLRTFLDITTDLSRKLRKHRRPAKNAVRDAEIVAMDAAGKTAGQIVQALRGRYTLTDGQVRAVLARARVAAAKAHDS